MKVLNVLGNRQYSLCRELCNKRFGARSGEDFDERCQDLTNLYVERDQKKVLQARRSSRLSSVLLRGSDGF